MPDEPQSPPPLPPYGPRAEVPTLPSGNAGEPQPVSVEDVREAIDDILQGDPAKFRPADILLVYLVQKQLARDEAAKKTEIGSEGGA